jgi:multidrug efflux pump
MNFSRFFVDRPIFAGVLSVIIVVAGFIAMQMLPISEYPEVTPPSVVVTAMYPGANPTVISETVAAPLEEQINGVEDMLYMSSQATTDGRLSITITFKLGSDGNLSQQLVQNRVSQALPRLPEEVRTLGVTVVKSSPDLAMVVHLISPKGRYDTLYLHNYAALNVKDKLARISGIGQARIFGGGDYAMRIWLDPQKISVRNMTAGDVVRAIREQNIQVAAGAVGASPNPMTLDLQLPINTQGRLQTPEQFGEIILKSNGEGGLTRLRDVARIEMGASSYGTESLLNNKSAAGIGLFQVPGSNAIEISDNVRSAMEQMKKSFPEDVDYRIAYDPTIFVRGSIEAVVHTLFEAIILVVIVVIVFLQSWRAAVIPLLAVPVSILGTFAFMYIFGFSINTLTLFGLVLAIGIVVDDAIVVVENVERNIHEGQTPRQATYQAMSEVTGPIVATALVLCAVFIPVAYISGLTGQFYRQFALTIAISTVISAFNSLTLSPALAQLLLKAPGEKKDALQRLIDALFGWFFRGFNYVFKRSSSGYAKGVKGVLRHRFLAMLVYAGLIGAAFWMFQTTPTGFVPAQDKQYLIGFAQLPDGATLHRTQDIIHRMSDIVMKEKGVKNAIAFPGLSINGFAASSSAGVVFVALENFDERKTPDLSAGAIAGRLNQKFGSIPGAFIMMFPPPPVRGIGMTGGFKLQIEDRMGQGQKSLYDVTQDVLNKARQTPELASMVSYFKINIPQLSVELDRDKAKRMGLAITDIYQTMQIYLGSLYINDFNQFGRTYQVIAQADQNYRTRAEDVMQLKVRNQAGDMVPLGTVLTIKNSYGPDSVTRYNSYPSADINGDTAPGFSSGQAQKAIVRILEETLPKGYDFEWTDLTYQQILAGNTAMFVFPLCILLAFLVLAAQYESLTLPLAVILIVPMSLLCAISAVHFKGEDNNIFTQIGLIVLVGLACKNAILIVEFARELEFQGYKPIQAAIESCRLRLRPILMTSFTFILGVVPLVLATGAGAEMRHAMGVAVFGGMLGVTFFGLLLTPVFYVVLRLLSGSRPLTGHHHAVEMHCHPMDDKHVQGSEEQSEEKESH